MSALSIIAAASSCLAATADITGQNLWGQYSSAYGGTVTTINATTDQAASGNASLVFDVADGNGLSLPQVVFAAPITGGTVTVTAKMYFPSTSHGAFLFGFDDGANGYYGGWYVGDSLGTWRDRWVAMKFVIDLDSQPTGNGTYYFDDMDTPAGTFDYGSDTMSDLFFLVGNDFNGTPVTGPFYFDDIVVEKAGVTVWSDNFDNYIAAGDANLVCIDAIVTGSVPVSGGVTGGLTGQAGAWNALELTGGTVTLSNLTNGAGAATGIGFVFDATAADYHVQSADAPYNPGRVLSDDNPERSWITGGESPVTFKFTGLTAGGNYELAVYTTGDPEMTLTINGVAHPNPGALFTTATTANPDGEIIGVASCGGETYIHYAELAGFQLKGTASPPALAASAGPDASVTPAAPSVQIGGNPTASGGTGPYTYSWTPATGLDDATAANPTASPTATTTYTVTVTDSNNNTASDSVTVAYSSGNSSLISIDVVRTDSTAVSGDVAGSPFTGQIGLWNRLVGSSMPATLNNLKDGGGGTTGVGLTAVFSGVTGFQAAGSSSGVVLAANDPERLWVTGTGNTLTLTFNGLTAGGGYDLAIYNTGSSKGTISINGGTTHTGVASIFTSSEVADGNGRITVVVGFNGGTHSDYMEISGVQLMQTSSSTNPFDTWAQTNISSINPSADASFAGDPDQDGVANGLEWILGGDPLASSTGKLPAVSRSSDGPKLVMTFKRVKASVGQATLDLQYSTDLGTPGPWVAVAVPEATGSAGGIDFTVTTDTGDSTMDDIVAEIPVSYGGEGGRLFARLAATMP